MNENLYPIEFQGRLWKEEEVNEIFESFYHSKDSLDSNCSVYVGDGMRIRPDGTWV